MSEAVNKVHATYDAQLHLDLIQGKNTTKKSGRFNTVDIVTAPAHLRWPNKGFQGVQRIISNDPGYQGCSILALAHCTRCVGCFHACSGRRQAGMGGHQPMVIQPIGGVTDRFVKPSTYSSSK